MAKIRIEEGITITRCATTISRAELCAAFNLPADAEMIFVTADGVIPITDDEGVIAVTFEKQRKPRARKGGK
jgi:hypothetical protein